MSTAQFPFYHQPADTIGYNATNCCENKETKFVEY